VLLDAHAAVYDRYLRYQMIAVVFRGEMAASEHRELKELALKRDAKGANKVLHTHIHDCVAHALRNSDWLKPVVQSNIASRANLIGIKFQIAR
jgi:DNA-binding GntR family transcriptional regulator